MKPSVYIILCLLLIYVGRAFVDFDHSLMGLLVVPVIAFLISKLLKRLLSDAIAYHNMTKNAPILESVYTGDITTFGRYLSSKVTIRTVISLSLLFFTGVSALLAFGLLQYSMNIYFSPSQDTDTFEILMGAHLSGITSMVCFTVAIFLAIFTLVSIWINIKLFRTKTRLHRNPTVEQCRDIAQTVFHLDYTSYCRKRVNTSYLDLFSQIPPRYYKAYRIITTICAVLIILAGINVVIVSLMLLLIDYDPASLIAAIAMVIVFAAPLLYCGISDLISCNSTSGTYRANIPSSTN